MESFRPNKHQGRTAVLRAWVLLAVLVPVGFLSTAVATADRATSAGSPISTTDGPEPTSPVEVLRSDAAAGVAVTTTTTLPVPTTTAPPTTATTVTTPSVATTVPVVTSTTPAAESRVERCQRAIARSGLTPAAGFSIGCGDRWNSGTDGRTDWHCTDMLSPLTCTGEIWIHPDDAEGDAHWVTVVRHEIGHSWCIRTLGDFTEACAHGYE